MHARGSWLPVPEDPATVLLQRRAEWRRHGPRVVRSAAFAEPLALPHGGWFARLAAAASGEEVDIAISQEESSEPTKKAREQLVAYLSRLAEVAACEGCRERSRCTDLAPLAARPAMGYAKQLELDELFPSLRYVSLRLEEALGRGHPHAYVWAGPAGSVTGMHNDDEDGALLNLAGRKRVRLFPPAAVNGLYRNSKYDSGTTCCDVDTDEPERFPLLATVQQMGWEVVLGPGDLLHIPKFYFHEVRSLEATVSVNFWSSGHLQDWTRGAVRRLFFRLHCMGMYRRGNCVCHSHEAAPRARL